MVGKKHAGTRRPNPRLIKIHRSYTVEQIGRVFGIHRNTVRSWVRSGLAPIDCKKPMLFLGRDLLVFVQSRRSRNKRPCAPGQLYCLKCRIPRHPAGGMADYEPSTDVLGNLVGICPDCETLMYRRVNLTKLATVSGFLSVRLPEACRHISESSDPSACAQSQVPRDHEKVQP